MSAKTVTRADLCEAVYQKVGLSRTESAALVELVLKEITDCLERGETVKLSSFGSFVVRKKGQRIGRNPKTGKEVSITSRRVMVFKPFRGRRRAQPKAAQPKAYPSIRRPIFCRDHLLRRSARSINDASGCNSLSARDHRLNKSPSVCVTYHPS